MFLFDIVAIICSLLIRNKLLQSVTHIAIRLTTSKVKPYNKKHNAIGNITAVSGPIRMCSN